MENIYTNSNNNINRIDFFFSFYLFVSIVKNKGKKI